MRLRIAFALLSCGCGADAVAPRDPSAACDPLDIELADGSCFRPGVPADRCGEGFSHDGAYGCNAIVPDAPCPAGTMAIPGDGACRPVMACGRGRWGDLPVDAATVYVDAAHVGSEIGSEAQPFRTIGAAVAAAADGALVAVAQGSYAENVALVGKPLRLWGVCPDRVTIAGTTAAMPPCPLGTALCVASGASGSELGGFSVTAPAIGIAVSGALDVRVERVRVHDTGDRGVLVEDAIGPASAELVGSLVEGSTFMGVFVGSATLSIDTSLVRGTRPRGDGRFGRGMGIEHSCIPDMSGTSNCDPAAAPDVAVRRSLVEGNVEAGIVATGATLTMDASLVRDNLPRVDQTGGSGVVVQANCNSSASSVVCDANGRSALTMIASVVERNREAGIVVAGSIALIDASVVRMTMPRALDGAFGEGVTFQEVCAGTLTAQVCDGNAASDGALSASSIDDSHRVGLHVSAAELEVDAAVVRKTAAEPSGGLYGDGISVIMGARASDVSVTRTLVQNAERAGVAIFGSALSLSATQIRCAAFALTAEPFGNLDFALNDGGGNGCGCPDAVDPCQLVRAGLQPPKPPTF